MEKLNYEDGFMLESIINKINEIVDRLDELEDRLDGRINSHWKFHRFLDARIERIEEKLGIKEEKHAEGDNKNHKRTV
jgi:ribosome assembly protein YihI (activator of Der GTPase)